MIDVFVLENGYRCHGPLLVWGEARYGEEKKATFTTYVSQIFKSYKSVEFLLLKASISELQ